MDKKLPTPDEIKRYTAVFDIVADRCVADLGHRLAPPCIKDADLMARDAVERYRDFCNGKAARE